MEPLAAAQFPSRADCNPYIHLLKTSLAECGVQPHEHTLFIDGLGHPYPALDQNWLLRHRGRVNLLHFHWLQKFYRAPSLEESEQRFAVFRDFLALARSLDYRIVYTFHNLFPHEGMGKEMDLRVRRLIIDQAHRFICFSNRQRVYLQETFGPMRLAVIPHPNYSGCYPDDLSPEECRRRLGLPEKGRVFAYIGLVRPYKELDHLIEEFSAVATPDTHLLLAGVPLEEEVGRQIEALAERRENVHCHLRWIGDAEMQVFLKASDAVVLPYDKCWSSGAMLLAFTFGKPVVSADPLMIDDPTGLGFFYEDGSGLRAALEQARDCENLKQMGQHCLEFARRFPWSEAGKQFACVYREAFDQEAKIPTTLATRSPA